MTNDDGMRVWLDGRQILNDWREDAARTSSVTVHLQGGKGYDLKVEYYDSKVYATAKLLWAEPEERPFQRAVQVAKHADAVVMVLGLSSAIEGESVDRKSLGLPEVQLDLLRAVRKATRKPIILVLVNGSPLTLGPDEMRCDAILEAWYPGMQGGNAVADVLLGKVSPSGRLPVTVVKAMADLPPFTDYSMKHRTYRYPGPKPQFPFGFGLSYSRFSYSRFQVPNELAMNSGLNASVMVTNVGTFEADELVQVYRHFVSPSRPMPEQQLVAFKRVHLKPGESRKVELPINSDDLKVLGDDTYLHGEQGVIVLTVGGGQPGYTKTLKARVHVGKGSRRAQNARG
jgi:beta-glucosidase